mgnify:CR=1 FL=1
MIILNLQNINGLNNSLQVGDMIYASPTVKQTNAKDFQADANNSLGIGSNYLVGILRKIEILPTPSGNILKALIESGVTCGVSSRGMGSLEQRGEIMEVQDDFELLCWDFVSTPSNPDSFMHLVRENKEFKAQDDYKNVNEVLREILCSHGSCPII